MHSMQIQTDVSLKDYSTMRLGGVADNLTIVESVQDLTDAAKWAQERNVPILVLGGGSNVIFSDGYRGLVIINRIPGFDILADDAVSTTIKIGAGENWDKIVARTVDMNLHGIEALSAIPGTAGATPVQNVGAYGAQISDTFVSLQAYDLQDHKIVTLSKSDCNFSYRHSIFKSPEHRRYIITSITLQLTKEAPQPPFYASLQAYLDQHNITDYSVQAIRKAVVDIRAVKLPDPARVANTGSFFKNPIIPAAEAAVVLKQFPDAPHWDMPGGKVKMAAGWLIEQAGLRGYAAHGMKTYEHHALVLVNDHATSYDDLAAFRDEIINKVDEKFKIHLEQEPEQM
jgi:UDP-N-acetylmuramate dehydrogenase